MVGWVNHLLFARHQRNIRFSRCEIDHVQLTEKINIQLFPPQDMNIWPQQNVGNLFTISFCGSVAV